MPTAAPPTRSAVPRTSQRGTSRAIYAVTGVVDEVADLIVPGAFARTLAARPVKTVWHHGWKDPVGVVVECEEWLPGDPRFRDVPGDWPAEAGALVATVIYNLRTRQGRDAYEQVKQWHEHKQAAFSIGYRVSDTGASKRGDGVRIIHDLDLFEVSPVLHGAHPLTRALEVKSAAVTGGGYEGLEYKTTPSHVEIDVVTTPNAEAIKVAGLAVKAADTGRLLMIQRALDDEDPAAGTWEIPGGHLEDGEDPLAAALREWAEETGSTLPGTASVVGSWTAPNGIYRGYVAVVPTEDSVPINAPHGERRVTNPDDPQGDATEVTAWWPITALPDMPLLRPECRETPWALLAGAALPQAPGPKASPQAKEFADGVMGRYQALGGEKKSAHAAVKSARALPRIEHKSARSMVAEAKSHSAPLEAPVMSPKTLPESQEQFRARLADAVRELLDQDGNTWTCIEGTYPDRVIVSVHTEDERRSSHYAIPYTVTAGEITLDKPQPVELATIVVPEGTSAARTASADEDVDARVVQPTVGALADATARVSSSTASPEQLEDVRDKVQELIAALSAKGLDVGDEEEPPATGGPARGSAGLDLWDDSTFGDDENTGPEDDDEEEDAEPAAKPEDTVRLDPDEVKAALALMRS
ncbi:ADP-ribose pyrophosphatase YjhB, NUDIX family [Streptomyces sp. 2131.1]|uniref:NUDIX domain-containing protein n=1 Tax=Streptomyces sp. 2131.1 TaxID=1855346 RepID=UPI0008954EC4|nr:NUDIX domain-containing protein [Streptomyces sp. 2131.1]SEE84414.1 ADP-ribose pyrophosphatase YjhB, NUDIX family [Streptomyces sp. 2131.1]